MRFLRNQEIVNAANDKIIELGLRRTAGYITDIVIAMIWSCLLGDIRVGILWEISYSVLRIYAGGYHATTEKRCKVMTFVSTLLCIYMCFMIPPLDIIIAGEMICLIGIIMLSPVAHVNKPLNYREKRVYKIYSIVILAIECIVIMIFWILHEKRYAVTVWVGECLVLLGMIVALHADRRSPIT